ncbi:MAG TPA: malto-oligosyltrehalose trehalohydrolase [Bryobacteraceae bacterium]|nr:malto-oligosyltrehalose trehalohydrolase [Bryobacteraceae bacterium]
MGDSMNVRHGAVPAGQRGWRFQVWAPSASRVELHLISPSDRILLMEPAGDGYFRGIAEDVAAGALYFYRLDGSKERPDPASRFQPQGVHGPSQLASNFFDWQDGAWRGLPLSHYILYEMHTGAFTPEGHFDAIIPQLNRLRDLGVTAIELMPVAQFPGGRNWGYDGVFPFAVQNSYGGPDALRRLVNACHQSGLAIVLDVVYNHLGPEGNYLADFGPYFTDRYKTPWGSAINFDGAASDEVRRFFVENALYWVREFHIDALRLDAIHAIFDQSAYPFLEQLGDAVHSEAEHLNRHIHVIPESDLNDPRFVRPKVVGGIGLDAQWNDDFHHALHTLLTGERSGYYADFGSVGQLAKAFREGFVYTGEHSSFRRRRHGAHSSDVPAQRWVVFSQNHDQVGNRATGDRLSSSCPFESRKLAAALVLLSPFLPLLFMGEEYGETAPFLYFVSHSDPALIEAVRNGRRAEFASFAWEGNVPDPQAEETFLRSKLDRRLSGEEPHRTLQAFYAELIRLRKTTPALALLSQHHMEVTEQDRVLCVRRWSEDDEVLALFSFSGLPARPKISTLGQWRTLLDSEAPRWRGRGTQVPSVLESVTRLELELAPQSAVVLGRTTREAAP